MASNIVKDVSRLSASRAIRSVSVGTETDGSDADVNANGTRSTLKQHGLGSRPAPALFHRVKDQRSILSLVSSNDQLFAGTQGGEIIVRLSNSQRVLTDIH
jgi:hypothetical protein